MINFVIRSAKGEYCDELQEWVDYGDGTKYTDDESAYDVASQLTARSLRIENTNGLVVTKLSK